MNKYIYICVLLSFLKTSGQDIQNTVRLYTKKKAIVFVNLKEPKESKRVGGMKVYAVSNRYLVIKNDTFNAGYLDQFRDPVALTANFSKKEIAKIPTDTSDFDIFLKPFFRDSSGTYPPENDINYGGETFTDNDTSQLIIAYQIKGNFFSTKFKNYCGLKRVFCFDNAYKEFTLVPTKVTQVKKLSKRQIKKMHLFKFPIKAYCFINCD